MVNELGEEGYRELVNIVMFEMTGRFGNPVRLQICLRYLNGGKILRFSCNLTKKFQVQTKKNFILFICY